MKFATNMDLVLNQLLNVVVENVASAPATGNKAGRIIFDASTNSFKFWNGTKWIDPSEIQSTVPVSKGGTGATTLASGQVLVGNGTGKVTTKAIDTTVTEDSTNLITSGAVKAYADQAVATGMAAAEVMRFMGTIDGTGKIVSSDASINGKTITALTEVRKGWTFKASAAISNTSISDEKLEAGDIIIFLDDASSYSKDNITIVQSNLDGAVIGPDSVKADAICVFDGTTGKLVKGSSLTITQLQNTLNNMFTLDATDADISLTSNNTTTSKVAAGNTVKASLKNTGVTAGTYGADNTATVSDGQTFKVPSITVDAKGRITKAETKTITVSTVDRYSGANPVLTPASGVCTWTVTHNLGVEFPTVNIYETATKEMVMADVTLVDSNSLTIKMNSDANITANTYTVVVVG